ncbi:uncharacterized protein METZ01_LOCUS418799, partial [marine metagenome]
MYTASYNLLTTDTISASPRQFLGFCS